MESTVEKIMNDYEQLDEYEKVAAYDMLKTYLKLCPEYREMIQENIEAFVKTYDGYAEDIARFEGEAGLH